MVVDSGEFKGKSGLVIESDGDGSGAGAGASTGGAEKATAEKSDYDRDLGVIEAITYVTRSCPSGVVVRAAKGALEAIQAGGGSLIDDFDGRRLVVYVEPGVYSLDAFFTEEETVSVEDSRLTVGDGLVLESGVLRNASGDRLQMDRPLQLFSRWYGFALTFPGTTIYGR